jgi:hypothetical protein
MPDSAKPMPRFPGGPDPEKPVPREPVRGVDLVGYAALAARLAEQREPRGAVLQVAGLDEPAWMEIERTWMMRIGLSALQGDTSLLREYDEAYLAAQGSLGPAEPTRTLEEYAAIVARIERGEPPPQVFAAAGLSLADFARLQRAWAPRIAQDPAMRDDFLSRVAALRQG